jgi:2,3-bisphosphoglycerate-independent phosphoglycerate mutase
VIDFPFLSQIVRKNDAKIVMLVLAGLGGAPDPTLGRSELEAARVPNLDHIALRGNLATLGANGIVQDRRAGGLSTYDAAPFIEQFRSITIEGVETTIAATIGHRFAVRFTGPGLSDDACDTDPMQAGEAPLQSRGSAKIADAINAFAAQAAKILEGHHDANAVVRRGAAQLPALESFKDSYQLNPAAITAFPLYQGLATATDMHLYPVEADFQAHLDALHRHWDEHDFFWMHYKEPSATPDRIDFNDKRRSIEAIDEHVRQVLDLQPDVLVITGDHANPSGYVGHTWHGVPFVIRSADTLAERGVDRFNERDLRGGSLGQFEAKHAMMLTLAHAGKLKQFGY